MAEELRLNDSDALVKVRSPWAVALLPFITLGIYHLVWWYRINREMRDYGRARGHDLGRNPTNSLLALFPGSLIVVPALVSYWRGTNRVQASARVGGREPVNGWIALILFLLISPAYWAYLQASINQVWLAEAAGLRGEPPVVEPSAMPARLPEADRTPAEQGATVASAAPTQAPAGTESSEAVTAGPGADAGPPGQAHDGDPAPSSAEPPRAGTTPEP
jgi:hypothetical protein